MIVAKILFFILCRIKIILAMVLANIKMVIGLKINNNYSIMSCKIDFFILLYPTEVANYAKAKGADCGMEEVP